MKNSASTALLLTLVMLAISGVNGACKACSQCRSCSPDVLSDKYLDDIDALLQAKIQQLGFLVTVVRNQSEGRVDYDIQYSKGLQVTLALMLDTMQIQLINYFMNTIPEVQTNTKANISKTTSDGYSVIENYGSNSDVSSIGKYLSGVVKTNFTDFQLIGAEYISSPALLYRLHYKVIPFSSSKPLVEDIIVQVLGSNSYQLIDSNYSVYSQNVTLASVDSRLVLSDPYISSINTIIVNKYRNFVGSNPSLISLAKNEPYYQFVYQVADTNYSFYLLYDYFQARVLQGNITSIKTVITAQATQNKIETQQNNSGSGQFVGGAANTVLPTGVPSNNSTITVTTNSTTAPTVSTSSSSSSTTTTSSTSSSSSQSASSSSSGSTSQTVIPQVVIPQNTVQTPQPQITTVTAQTATQGFQQIIRFSTSTEVISALSYLSSLNQSLSMSQIQSVQKMNNGSSILYKISVKLLTIGQLELKGKAIFYQYLLSFSPATSTFSIANATYVNLDEPAFTEPLLIDDIKADTNIREIARFLLSRQFAMLSSNSRVLAVFRDVPYYKLVFEASGNSETTFVILFNFNGNTVSVLSATTQQRKVADSIITTVTTSNTSASTVQSIPSAQTVIPSNTPASAMGTSTTSQSTSNQYLAASDRVQSKQTTIGSSKITSDQTNQNTSVQKEYSTIKVTPLPTQTSTPPVQPATSGSTTTSSSIIVNNQQVSSGNVRIAPIISVNISKPQSQTEACSTDCSSETIQSVQPVLVSIPVVNQSSSSQTNVQSTSVSSSSAQQSVQTGQSSYLKQQTVGQTGFTNQNVVQNPINTTIASSPTFFNPVTETSLNGFTHFSSTSDPLYQYVLQAMNKINAGLSQKGYKQSEIIYRDIIYKLVGTTLIILIKVEASGFMFSYQYKGTVGNSIILSASTVLPSSTTTSTTATSDTSNVADSAFSIIINNIIYQRISESILNQSYIQQYLNYLENSDICYQRKNLVGVFTNPQIANSFFFRFRNNTQYYNIFTSSNDISKTISNYLKTKEQTSQSSQTIVQPTIQPVQTTLAAQTVQQPSLSVSVSSQAVQQSATVPQANQNPSVNYQASRKSISQVDPNCLCYDRDRCLKCHHRFYLNNNQCIQVAPECQSYDQITGICLKCIPGFQLNSGLCQLEDVSAYFIEGQCVSCFGNYRLINRKCVYIPVTNVTSPEYMQAKNPLCFSWNGPRCTDCLPGTYLSNRGICQLVDPFCAVFNYAQQICSNCENGYAVRYGRCYKAE